MGLFRGAGYLAITTLVLLSLVAGSQAKLKDQFTTWTPNGCNYSADGRAVDLVLRSKNERECGLLDLNILMIELSNMF